MKLLKKQLGFTIIELIIAISLLGAVGIGTGAYLSNSFKHSNQVASKAEVQTSVTALMNFIAKTIKTADIPVFAEDPLDSSDFHINALRAGTPEDIHIQHDTANKVVIVKRNGNIVNQYNYIQNILVDQISADKRGARITITGDGGLYELKSSYYTRNTLSLLDQNIESTCKCCGTIVTDTVAREYCDSCNDSICSTCNKCSNCCAGHPSYIESTCKCCEIPVIDTGERDYCNTCDNYGKCDECEKCNGHCGGHGSYVGSTCKCCKEIIIDTVTRNYCDSCNDDICSICKKCIKCCTCPECACTSCINKVEDDGYYCSNCTKDICKICSGCIWHCYGHCVCCNQRVAKPDDRYCLECNEAAGKCSECGECSLHGAASQFYFSDNLCDDCTPKVTVIYDANGGNNAPATGYFKIKDTEAIVNISTVKPSRNGWIFMGWSTLSKAYSVEYKSGETVVMNNSSTLYAVWARSVTFSSNGYTVSFKDISLPATVYVYEYYEYGKELGERKVAADGVGYTVTCMGTGQFNVTFWLPYDLEGEGEGKGLMWDAKGMDGNVLRSDRTGRFDQIFDQSITITPAGVI